jgi:PhnB protein
MSDTKLIPYLFFIGNCSEAMDFYKSVFGGDLNVSHHEGEMAGKIMHAHLSGGQIELMASDGTRQEPYPTGCISLSLGGTDMEGLSKTFDMLGEGGKVEMPLQKQFWGDTFGMLTDKFGIDWMINISAA